MNFTGWDPNWIELWIEHKFKWFQLSALENSMNFKNWCNLTWLNFISIEWNWILVWLDFYWIKSIWFNEIRMNYVWIWIQPKIQWIVWIDLIWMEFGSNGFQFNQIQSNSTKSDWVKFEFEFNWNSNSLNFNSKELNSGFKRIVATLRVFFLSMMIQKYVQLQEFSDGWWFSTYL